MAWKIRTHLIIMSLWVLCTGCSHIPTVVTTHSPAPLAYTAATENSLISRYAPIISVENSNATYNRVGSVKAEYKDNGEERLFIEPKHATFYVSHREFTSTLGNQYTNLIYRIHFEKVPYRLLPFHLTAGNNGGLIIIITLNQNLDPLLVTTVHSCGCYLAFTPTSLLTKEAFPSNWNWDENKVFGETLPPVLTLPTPFDETSRPLIRLRDGTHRVMDISSISLAQAKEQFTLVHGELTPIKALKKLPFENKIANTISDESADKTTTSFYHTEGLRKGYVKNATKPFELLLMSWWTFDLFVGRDKEFGPSEETGTVFYTSLKPWRRKDSDMWPFERFLDFWGWQL